MSVGNISAHVHGDQDIMSKLPSSVVEDMANFRPMQEDYGNPEFNSYMWGPGTDLHTSLHVQQRREKSNFKLHVTNIPSDLTTKAVKNVFNIYGDVCSVFVKQNQGMGTQWGFVEYEKFPEAQNAVTSLDKAPPYNLNVKFAMTKESKPEKVPPVDENTEYWDAESNRVRREPYLLGVEPLQHNGEDGGAQAGDVYCDGQFSPYAATTQTDVNNLILATMTITTHNEKRVSGGRMFVPTELPLELLESNASNNLTSWRVEDTSKPTKQSGNAMKNIFNEISKPGSLPSITTPFAHETCTVCGMISVTTCRDCSVCYCNSTCIEEDWAEHQIYHEQNALTDVKNNGLRGELAALTNGTATESMLVVARDASFQLNKNGKFNPRFTKYGKLIVTSNPATDLIEEINKKLPAEPPIPWMIYTHCFVVHIVGAQEKVYITPVVWAKKQETLMDKMFNYYGQERPPLVNVSVGKLCAALHSDYCWYRAKILLVNRETEAAKVIFIDFGNEETVSLASLKALPGKLSLPLPMAFRISIPCCTEPFALYDKLQIAPIREISECYWQVKLPQRENSPSYTLHENQFQEITIMHREEPGEYLVVTLDGMNRLLELEKLLEVEAKGKTSVIPQTGQMYNCQFRDKRCRAVVTCVKPLSVFLVDEGKLLEVCPEDLSALSFKLKSVPELAVRVKFAERTTAKFFHLDETARLKVKPVGLVSGMVEVVVEGDSHDELGFPERLIEEVPAPAFPLDDGSLVVLSSFYSPRAIYVRQLDCSEVLETVMQDLAALCSTAKPMTNQPFLGELVIAKWKDDHNFYRAAVLGKTKENFKVVFLDFGNVQTVALEDLRQLPDNFKQIPATAIKIGLKHVAGRLFNKESTQILNDLLLGEVVFRVNHAGDLSQAVLTQESSGDVINSNLAQAMETSWARDSSSSLFIGTPYMDIDLSCELWDEKTTVVGIVVGVKSYSEVLFQSKSTTLSYIEEVLSGQISEYWQAVDSTGYRPRPCELVLAKYKTGWYRAVCKSVDITVMTASVFFVDYGNYGELPWDDLRKMVPEFVEVPSPVKFCTLTGFPPSESIFEETKERLMSAVQSITEIQIVKEDSKCIVWAPALPDILGKLGLSATKPEGLS